MYNPAEDDAERNRIEQFVDPVPRPVMFGHVTPGSTGPGPPPYACYQLPPRPRLRTTWLDAPWQLRLKPGPLAVRQIPTSHDR